MGYEIPQQLEHKEHIMFGLTFTQLGWASLWGFCALVSLTSHADKNLKIILAVVFTAIGGLFVFFDVWAWLKNTAGFVRFREIKLGSIQMRQLMPVTEVRKRTIKTDEEIAVLKIFPLNFGIKTKEEQESVIIGFQKFLNSLDFPIQILVTTQQLKIDPYLKGLKERTQNEGLYNEFAAFAQEKIAAQRNREFYVLLPKRTNLEIQINVCQERLRGMGLETERLPTAEILTLLQRLYNKKDSLPPQGVTGMHYLISPQIIRDHADHLDIDGQLVRVITATGYPRSVENGFLDKIISSNEDYDISMHIEPFSIETTMIILNQELQKQRADLYAEEQRKSINPSLEIKYRDTLKVLEALQKGEEKLFNVSLAIACKAKTKEELDLLTRKVESELHSTMIIPKTPLLRQKKAFKTMMPLGRNYLGVRRNITTRALSAFFPFTSPFLTMELSGTLLGLNKNNVPYIKDIFNLNNANGIVLATSGAGKSYFTKLLISRQLLNNTSVTVIDPQGEYKGLTQACNGELITISRTSETIINPLDLMGHDYIEKRLALMDLFKIMFGELSEVQKSILDKAINITYAKKGISGKKIKKKKEAQPPILQDLYKTLVRMDAKAAQSEKITYRALINRLYLYTEGVFGFLNRQSNINYENDFVCFNIGDMPKQVKPVIMFLILDYAYMRMKQRPGRKLFVVDEAWSLLSRAEEAGYLFEIVKTCRKFNMGLLLITQDVADLLNSAAGHAVLANSSYTFLLRQKPAIIDTVARTFHLSQAEKEYLLTATQGKGILILDNDHQELTVIASTKEHALITTNPNEVEAKPVKDDREEIDINLDPEKGLYYDRNLTDEEKAYLSSLGYSPISAVPIGKPRQETCWIRTNGVEGSEHNFLVYNIKEHLSKYTRDFKINVTRGADIEFTDKKGKRIAIEVETGAQYDKKRKQFDKKFIDLDQEFDKVYIVLSDTNYKRRYEQALKTKIYVRKNVPTLLRNVFGSRIRASRDGDVGSINADFKEDRV